MKVTLTTPEQRICYYLAKGRYDANRNSGVVDALITSQISPFQADLDGLGAEMGFCKIFNLYPDFSLEPRKGGHDCVLHNGTRVDVKQNRHTVDPYLIVKKTKTIEDADVYALMVGTFPSYRYAGFILAQDIIKEENLMDWGYEGKEGYSVSESRLTYDSPEVDFLERFRGKN